MRLLSILLLAAIVNLPNAFSAEVCSKFTSSLKSLNEIPKKNCVEIRDSKQCQDFYKTLSATLKPDDLAKRKLTCDKTAWDTLVSVAIPLPAKGACQDGVADFALGIVNSFKSIGKKLADNAEKNNSIVRECAESAAGKQRLIVKMISKWPKLMQPKSIPADLQTYDCLNIKTKLEEIEHSEKTKLATQLIPTIRSGKALSAEQTEAALYLNPDLYRKAADPQSIANMASGLMDKIKNSATCYSSEYQTELYCEALATAASFLVPGMQPLKAARLEELAAMAGRKLTEDEIGALADQAVALSKVRGKPGVIPESRKSLVDAVGVLDDGDRLALASKILGRRLTDTEETAILKAHNLPSNQLAEKIKILKDAGIDDPDTIAVFMRSSITGQPAAGTYESFLKSIDAMPDGAAKFRLLAERELGKPMPDLQKANKYFEDATNDLAKNVMTKANPSPIELSQVEYAAGRYGSQTTDAAEIARTQQLIGSAYEKRLSKEMTGLADRTRNSNGMTINDAQVAQDYVDSIRTYINPTSSVGKKAIDKAANFQADAIVNYLNKVKKWNLK